MQRETVLGAVLGARAPVADHALAEGDEGKARRLWGIVINPHAAEKRRETGGIRQRLVDTALERPTRNCRHSRSPLTFVNQTYGVPLHALQTATRSPIRDQTLPHADLKAAATTLLSLWLI